MSEQKQMQVRVYDSHSEVGNILVLIRSIFSGFIEGHDLAWRLLIRDKKAMYRQSVLGLFWAFLPPIATSLIWIYLNSSKVISIETTDIPYPVYVFAGVMLFQIFKEALSSPLAAVNGAKSIMVKLNFPREAILLKALYLNMFNALIKIAILILVLIFFQVHVTWMLLLVPFGIISLIFLGWGIGIWLVPMGMLYSDVGNALGLFSQFLMYLTPVLFPIPDSGIARYIIKYNPITPLLINTRNWLTTGEIYDLNSLLMVMGSMFFITLVGLVMYKVSLPHLIERMGS